MKKKLMALGLFLMLSVGAFAGEKIQLGLVNPVQLVPEGSAVDGLRLGLIYTKNSSVKGVDVNWLISDTTGKMEGVQVFGLLNITGSGKGGQIFNVINYSKGDFEGVELASINITKGFKGGRLATINYSENLDGVELGWVNISKNVKGFQVGFINYTENMESGLQIGLVNIFTNGKLPVLPIINGKF